MRRLLALGLALTAALPLPLRAQQAVAVFRFESGGSFGRPPEEFAALEAAIPVVLAGVVERYGATAVARSRLRSAVERLRLPADRRVDAATAARAAGEAGAGYAVTGGFMDFYGRLRLTARLVDARSGEILRVVSVEGDRNRLGVLVDSVGARLAAELRLPGTAGAVPPEIPVEAFTLFGSGILAEDAGDASRAAEFYRRAVELAPGFEEPRRRLEGGG